MVGGLAAALALGGAVYAISRPDADAPQRPPARATDATPITEPGGGRTLFPSHRLVAFYGEPANSNLGILGTAPAEQLWPQLEAAAAPYTSPGTAVVPSYELIAFAAQATAGADGTFTTELPAATISAYLQVVHAHGGMLILDIQPGRSSLLADAQALAPWLADPDVAVALDPEWELAAGQRPGTQIGHTTAAEINQVSAWMQQLTVTHHLPQKLLMIHQFRPDMLPDKPAVVTQANLAIAFNMDGFGPPDKKISVYNLLATDVRWPLGYKLFYTRDAPLQAPAEVLGLAPPPWIVEYE